MLQIFNRDHLLPRLQYLSTTRSNPILRFLASPSLRIICTDLTEEPSETHLSLQSFLGALPTAASNITTLKLSHPLTDHTFDTVSRFPRLEFLYLGNTDEEFPFFLPEDFLRKLSLLESLQILYLSGDLTIFPIEPTNSGVFNFPRLEQILLVSGMSSINTVNNFLRVVSLPCLDSLTISIYGTLTGVRRAPEKDGWITFFRLLRQATAAQLSSLFLRSHLHCSQDDWVPIELDLSLSNLPDLLALPLTAFSFSFFHSVSTTDILHMVDSWKGLSYLNVSSIWRTLPNFSVLIKIAAGLPRLTDMAISVDCRELPAIDKTPLLCHRLEELKLHNSRLQDPFKFARCLDRIFPHLKIREFNSKNVKEQDLWNQASEFLAGLRQVRADERKRMRRVKPKS